MLIIIVRSCSCCINVNTIFESLYSKLTDVIDKHAPVKELSKKEIKFSSKPWITKGIKTSIKEKNRLFKKYLKTKSPYDRSKYKLFRNKLSKILCTSKKINYNKYFTNNSNNIKNIWKGIRELTSSKLITKNIPSKLIANSSEIKDARMIANTFNNYFSSIGEKVASSIAPTAVSPLAYMDPPQLSSLLLHPVTTDEIKKEISMLDPSKTTGPFSIPIKLLKIVQDYLCKPLQKLFNCSLTTGTVPDKFKLAHVIPVFKKGSQTCVSNYRPISLLSCFNRLLEKLMYKRLFNFLDNKKILFDNQYGFRTKHSTTQATLLIIDKIQRAIEERNYSCGIFLDLSKAFDSVDHSILLTLWD